MLVVGVWQGIEMKSFQVAGYGLILALGSFYAAGVSLNLNSVNINLSEEATTGEEAIGIISLAMKIMLKSIAVIFGLLMCYEAIGLVKTAYGMIQSNRFAISARQMHAIGRGAGIALLPFAAYLGYTVYYLLLDVLRAILQIPQKLDDMNG
jgi:hypothetical protein